MSETKIKHNTYYDGGVQSLEFTTADGQRMSIGVVKCGASPYRFPPAEEPELIQVIGGVLIINETRLCQGETHVLLIHEGESIALNTPDYAAYLCRYGFPKPNKG